MKQKICNKGINLFVVFLYFSVSFTVFVVQPFFITESFAEQKEIQKVTFNFVDVDLLAVTKFISEITGKNFILDDRVKGKITIIAPTKLSVDDAFSLFTSVLELKGFAVVPSGVNAFKILPSVEAKQQGMKVVTDKLPLDESYVARLIPLQHISSEEAQKSLKPIISKDGHISDFGHGNLILVVDNALNINKILSIVELIDKPYVAERPELVLLKHASADSVAKIINEGFGKGKTMSAPHARAEVGTAVADQRLNAVILFGDKSKIEAMKSLISLIDVPSPEAQGRINVYFLENADATELAKVLDGIVKGAQPHQKAAGVAPATPFEAVSGIIITADKSTNSLIIVASPADYQNLVQVIKQLDKRRRQVFVEAMIVEASIDKLKEIGTKWRAIAKYNGEPVVIGGFGTMDPAAIQSVINGLSGLTIGGMGNFLDIPVTTFNLTTGAATSSTLTVPGFSALFSLDEFKDAVNILSTPQILTSDNKEAEIVVGENVPFISKRERDITTTNTVLSSIERKDVGITLKLTPQVTEGDYVKLDIYQEISSVKQDSPEIIINVGPTTTKRSTKTSVVVKDKQTVVIGGLMQERDEESITKVPVLGDIPLFGWLFKHKSTSKKKTNLLVFLTPHIVKESESLAKITQNKQREFQVAEKRFAEGELLIKFKDNVDDATAREIISKKGASVIRFMKEIGVYHIKLRNGQDVEAAMKEFSAMPEVQYSEPNYIIRMQNEKK